MKKIYFMLSLLLVIGLLLAGCAEEVPEEFQETGKTAVSGQAVYLTITPVMLAKGLSLDKGSNTLVWPVSGLDDNLPAEEVFASLGENLNYVQLSSKKSYYIPSGSSLAKHIPAFQGKGWLFDKVQLGKKYAINMKQSAILQFPVVKILVPEISEAEPVSELKVCNWLGYTQAYDYNADGIVDKKDQDLLASVVMKKAACPIDKICDVNLDQATTATDLQKFTLELEDCLNGINKPCIAKLTGKIKCVPESNYYSAVKEYQSTNCNTYLGSGWNNKTWCGQSADSCSEEKGGCCQMEYVPSFCEGNLYVNGTKNLCTNKTTLFKTDCSALKGYLTNQSEVCGTKKYSWGNASGCFESCIPGEKIVTCSYGYYEYTCNVDGLGYGSWKNAAGCPADQNCQGTLCK